MKIISGKYKGRTILGFDIDGTRPTMDRVKESLFGMIQEYIPGACVLDLFSGSGNLGIEALSWGASFAYLCDYNKKALKVIHDNISIFGIDNCKIIDGDYTKSLKEFKNNNLQFDIIFLDPPYKSNYLEKSLLLISEYNLLSDDGIIICESDSIDKVIFPSSYIVFKERRYGAKWVVILKKI